MGFILSGIYFGWGSLKTGFSFGEIRVRRDSVLARFALGEIHFGGISDDGFWNGGILSYSPLHVALTDVYTLWQKLIKKANVMSHFFCPPGL